MVTPVPNPHPFPDPPLFWVVWPGVAQAPPPSSEPFYIRALARDVDVAGSKSLKCAGCKSVTTTEIINANIIDVRLDELNTQLAIDVKIHQFGVHGLLFCS